MTVAIFLVFVGAVLGLSFWLGAKAKSAQGYYAAHGQIPWFVNGIAFAGDYLSAASFLGICGLIATGGYDGFLYSIGFLAGWVVALFVVAEPLKRMGRFTFADALDRRFDSRGIKLAAAISTLVVSIFYLIPQMVGAGSIIKPLLGLDHVWGVMLVGGMVTVIVTTAGMVSTTWVQFIKGTLLVLLCAILAGAILVRGLSTAPPGTAAKPFSPLRILPATEVANAGTVLAADGAWAGKPYVRVQDADGVVRVWTPWPTTGDGSALLAEAQTIVTRPDGTKLINGSATGALRPVGHVHALPGGATSTGPLSPAGFITTLQDSTIATWVPPATITGADGTSTVIHAQKPVSGDALMRPGAGMFKGLDNAADADSWKKQLNFLSLMLALFAGTASLPHILIRYYTVKDQTAARRSTVVGIAAIGTFYVLTLFIGLGAMTGGVLDLSDPKANTAAPLLAHSFGDLFFALITAIAFTTILGTVSGLIMAASGAVAHDLIANVGGYRLSDRGQVTAGRIVAIVVGATAMVLGVLFKDLNVSFLVGWAFAIAASANLPALTMLLFWKGTTRQGIIWSVAVGLITSLTWVLLSGEAYANLYKLPAASSPVPFNQPGIVTIPLAYAVLVVVSLMTARQKGVLAR